MKRLSLLMVVVVITAAAAGCRKNEENVRESVVVVAPPAVSAPLIEQGGKVFAEKCVVCHMINGKGGTVGTDLTSVGKRHDAAFLQTLLQNPKQYYPQGVKMPAFNDMKKEDRDALIAFLLSLR